MICICSWKIRGKKSRIRAFLIPICLTVGHTGQETDLRSLGLRILLYTESIEFFIEDQAFVVRFGSFTTTLPALPISNLYRRRTGRLRMRYNLLTGEVGGVG
jgi:hypothetical protein